MDARAVAHVLEDVATLLDLHGRPNAAAFRAGARAVAALQGADLRRLATAHEGEGLSRIPGLDDAPRAVVADLLATGDSELRDRLREETPEGLFEMLRLPGLGPARIRQLHDGLGIESVQELEEAARDGRLATLPRFGDAMAARILRGIAQWRETGTPVLLPHAMADAARLAAWVREHPAVTRVEIAGAVRRAAETVAEFDVVLACQAPVVGVLASFTHGARVREAIGAGGKAVTLRLDDGVVVRLHGAAEAEFPLAWWRATGNDEHVAQVRRRLADRGLRLSGDTLRDADGRLLPVADEAALYAAAGMAYVPPERREARGEVDDAARGPLGRPLEVADLRGALHCHSGYSDGASQIAALADAAAARGWAYVGISDHSQSNPHAGGMDRDAIRRQHDEIDAINASRTDVRVLKGVEADILPCGRLDFDEATLDAFDYVIGSVHTRFGMNEAQMTERMLKALDAPHLTILGHPTGRLLLTREPYAVNLDAVLEKAGAVGVAVELNADPHRMDLDWRWLPTARRHGVAIEIAPDAHAVASLDHVALGVLMGRKGGLGRDDVLNARDTDGVMHFARARRQRALTSA
jgi:DNA polymerase (family X)